MASAQDVSTEHKLLSAEEPLVQTQPGWERGAAAKGTARAGMALEASLKITLKQAIQS